MPTGADRLAFVGIACSYAVPTKSRRLTIERSDPVRRLHAQVTILALGGATLLDDGSFLVIVAATTTMALILCGGRRLLAAAHGSKRYANASASSLRREAPPPSPDSASFLAALPGTDAGLGLAAPK